MGPVLGVGGFLEAQARSLQGSPRPAGPGRAGPVRSSVAAPDCCGGLGNLDFRKVHGAGLEGCRGRGLFLRRGAGPPLPGNGGGAPGRCLGHRAWARTPVHLGDLEAPGGRRPEPRPEDGPPLWWMSGEFAACRAPRGTGRDGPGGPSAGDPPAPGPLPRSRL